ncbi:hypothetical protein [Mesorhizobium sp. B2-5-3]|uniref:hypothetical protein n=1 Tax=Mesorhizobium sp. B2-5-3 TaxID=2589927 RepID=UPI00112E88E6|nr:hypothetical protein [Mesorhizobium sp. B2-5-3]TPK38700.1 hypothetical protein FJ867_08835 [Mesorhizobium sp. B2-5-3]
MGVKHGKNGKVKFANNAVGQVTSIAYSETVDTGDTTVMGSTAKTHVPGIPGWSGKVECIYDPADANGQAAALIGSSVTIGFYLQGDTVGLTYVSGTASITSVDGAADLSKASTFSFGVTGNGALTYDEVAA